MDIKYFTPQMVASQWLAQIPTSQRTTGGTAPSTRIFLPEGIHTVKVLWEGTHRYFLRYYPAGSATYRDLLPTSVDPTKTKNILIDLVVAPGGGELVMWFAALPTTTDTEPPKIIFAGITVFMGTNET